MSVWGRKHWEQQREGEGESDRREGHRLKKGLDYKVNASLYFFSPTRQEAKQVRRQEDDARRRAGMRRRLRASQEELTIPELRRSSSKSSEAVTGWTPEFGEIVGMQGCLQPGLRSGEFGHEPGVSG